jgi:hypothetical protein
LAKSEAIKKKMGTDLFPHFKVGAVNDPMAASAASIFKSNF